MTVFYRGEIILATLRGDKPGRVLLDLQQVSRSYDNPEQVRSIDDDPGHREIVERVFDHTVGFIHHPTPINRYLVTPPQRIQVVDRRIKNDNSVITREISTPKGILTPVHLKN